MISLLIYAVLVLLVVAAFYWIVNQILTALETPAPARMIVNVIFALILILVLVYVINGIHTGNLPSVLLR